MSRAARFPFLPLLICLLLFVLSGSTAASARPAGPAAGEKGCLRDPDLHGDRLVFSSSGDIMIASLPKERGLVRSPAPSTLPMKHNVSVQ